MIPHFLVLTGVAYLVHELLSGEKDEDGHVDEPTSRKRAGSRSVGRHSADADPEPDAPEPVNPNAYIEPDKESENEDEFAGENRTDRRGDDGDCEPCPATVANREGLTPEEPDETDE